MGQEIELKNEHLRCVIRADLGGSIVALEMDAGPVLRVVDSQHIKSARQSGSFALVPFSNRIAHATLSWMDNKVTLNHITFHVDSI